MSNINEAIAAEVDKQMHAIRYNLQNTIGGLLYSLKLEMERDGNATSGINELISNIIHTSRYTGPDGEEYPIWNEKENFQTIKKLQDYLQKHGIEQIWNIGRSKHQVNS